ncbi:MAG: hypothetical protein J1F67_01275 [Muribaculaceae bacterium]|nr:hypothetical protein [Muribaculaceae bacterium]
MFDEVIDLLLKRVKECKDSGNMFILPQLPSSVKVEEKRLKGYLFHEEYTLTLPSGELINIDYSSRDRDRTFQPRPDRSVIQIECKEKDYSFSSGWDETLS